MTSFQQPEERERARGDSKKKNPGSRKGRNTESKKKRGLEKLGLGSKRT